MYAILDEVFLAGEIEETSKNVVLVSTMNSADPIRSDVECELFNLFPLCSIIFVTTGSIGLPGKTRMNPHNLLL